MTRSGCVIAMSAGDDDKLLPQPTLHASNWQTTVTLSARNDTYPATFMAVDGALHSCRESAASNRPLLPMSRRLDNDRHPVCVNGVAMSRSAAPNSGQLKAVGST